MSSDVRDFPSTLTWFMSTDEDTKSKHNHSDQFTKESFRLSHHMANIYISEIYTKHSQTFIFAKMYFKIYLL